MDPVTVTGQLAIDFDSPIVPLLTPDHIYGLADESLLRILSEDRRIERKSAQTDPRRLGDYFSMWANTPPAGGLIALGVEKDGTMGGCVRLSYNQLNDREKSGLNFCPDARYSSRRIPVINGDGNNDFVLLIRVMYREDKVVTTAAGDAFIRIGDEKHKLSDEEVKELKIDKRELDFEREGIDLVWPSDFDDTLISAFCSRVKLMWQLHGDQTDEQILAHRRLGKISNGVFCPNVACALVFGREPANRFPGCKVRFLRYEGELEKTGEQYNVVKDRTVEGNIPELIVETADVIRSQLRQFSKIETDGKFYTVPEYPLSAWYEALVNACVHRSYGLRNRNIFVKMFDDRLVIESPGGFPPTVTPENIYDVHHPRNPNVMEALRYLDFVKCHNEGTRRMRDTMAEHKLPTPEFQQKASSAGYYTVRVTLRNNVKQRKAWVDSALRDVVGEPILKSLRENERIVMNFVCENGSINVSECQRLLSLKRWHNAKVLLMGLVKRKLLLYQKVSRAERGKSYFKIPLTSTKKDDT